jgi:hypothetical protein
MLSSPSTWPLEDSAPACLGSGCSRRAAVTSSAADRSRLTCPPLGYLTQDDGRWCTPFYDNCSDVSGAAVLAEAGVLFFRDLAHGRVAMVGQLIEPLFSHSRLYPTPLHETLRTVVLGLRVLY